MSNEIAMHCGTPLVWTFMFSGSEYFCMKCRRSFGFIDGEVTLENHTPKLGREHAKNKRDFYKATKPIVLAGMRLRRGCKKCNTEDHYLHITPEQKAASDQAIRDLLDSHVCKCNSMGLGSITGEQGGDE